MAEEFIWVFKSNFSPFVSTRGALKPSPPPEHPGHAPPSPSPTNYLKMIQENIREHFLLYFIFKLKIPFLESVEKT